MHLFELLFDEWQEAEQAANTRWASVCHAHEQWRQGLGPRPTQEEVRNAIRLRRLACEWLVALRAELRNERERVVRI
jgi:hypothetical protein